jgi:hypothetical protein
VVTFSNHGLSIDLVNEVFQLTGSIVKQNSIGVLVVAPSADETTEVSNSGEKGRGMF